jgi:hypothetical protein
MVKKKFEIQRGNIFYREEIKFKSKIHFIYWKFYMRAKGCCVKELSVKFK